MLLLPINRVFFMDEIKKHVVTQEDLDAGLYEGKTVGEEVEVELKDDEEAEDEE